MNDCGYTNKNILNLNIIRKMNKNFLKRTRMLLAVVMLCVAFFMIKGCKHSDPFLNIGDEQPLKPVTRSGELSWDYPIKPGMESWNSLATEEERIAVVQVPENILATLSPEEVVGLCITFPSFGHFTAWNTPQEGFVVMLSRYNILRHILSCNDVGGSLIAAYKDAGMTGFRTLPYSNEFWSLKLLYLELVLSQKEILQSMTPDEKFELITEARSKYFEKISNENFAGLPEMLFSFRIMVSILDVEGYPELMASPNRETITEFISSGWLFDKELPISEIGRIIDNYINSKN